jgi:cytochrome c556
MRVPVATMVMTVLLAGCQGGAEPTAPPVQERADPVAVGPGGWLRGDTADQLGTVAGQLRGFDVAMAEVGYRFNELYFAGQDRNWDLARYQIEHIGVAIDKGLERRPKRAPSARPFLDQDLPRMEEAVDAEDPERFAAAFEQLRQACMGCHRREDVPFMQVATPQRRLSPLAAPEPTHPEPQATP